MPLLEAHPNVHTMNITFLTISSSLLWSPWLGIPETYQKYQYKFPCLKTTALIHVNRPWRVCGR